MERKVQDCLYNVNLVFEYLRWLRYVPEFEKEKIDNMANKHFSELLPSEQSELKCFRIQQGIIPIFERFLLLKANDNDSFIINHFMNEYTLDKIIKSKLSNEEYVEAHEIIDNYFNSSMGSDDIEKINDIINPEYYQSLTMVESYILYELWKTLDFSNAEEVVNSGAKINNIMRYSCEHNTKQFNKIK